MQTAIVRVLRVGLVTIGDRVAPSVTIRGRQAGRETIVGPLAVTEIRGLVLKGAAARRGRANELVVTRASRRVVSRRR